MKRVVTGGRQAGKTEAMRTSQRLIPVDIYVKHTAKDGTVTLAEHTCWDVERFLKMLARGAAQVGGKARADRLTLEQYRREQLKQDRRRA